MLNSMTGYASANHEADGFEWSWDIRGVNSKGLDVRVRVPDWVEGLEAGIRAAVPKAISRGSISIGVRVNGSQEQTTQVLNGAQLDAALDALEEIEDRAMRRGVSLAPSKASDIISLRGVFEAAPQGQDIASLTKAILGTLPDVLKSFNSMRQVEGLSLSEIMEKQISEISSLTEQAATIAETRKEEMKASLAANLARVMENTDGVDEARVAQELAVLVVKADITEEIDRLKAHVKAAQDLVEKGSPIGRKLDFLMQEFNREANTLCSKAQNVDLTRVGLDLKTVIDQMREQVQNVE